MLGRFQEEPVLSRAGRRARAWFGYRAAMIVLAILGVSLPAIARDGAQPADAKPAATAADAGSAEAADGSSSIVPPSPFDRLPPEKGFGRVRVSCFAGWSSASIRKDADHIEGDRLSWSDDLEGASWFAGPQLIGEFRIRKRVYSFLDFGWFHQSGTSTVGAAGLRFDGVTFAPGTRLSVAASRLLVDTGFLAWGTVEDDYRLAIGLGARYMSTSLIFDGLSQRTRETNESVYPFLEGRGEYNLSDRITLEGSGRISLFTMSYREVVETEDHVVQYVDSSGNPVGEQLVSSERNRYLKTQINALIDLRLSVRFDMNRHTSVFAGLRFSFNNAERIWEEWQEDLEWRAFGLEAGFEFRF